jgi:pimeloyl-ACP methyl ester carboxylesterase
MPTVAVRDIEMYYEEHGKPDGEPIVLLHGFMGRGKALMRFAGPLGERYRVLVPDWRGHGQTNNPAGRILHSELGLDLAAFCDVMKLPRAHFVGFSSGAMQQFPLVFARPELVHSMTLCIGTYDFDEYSQKMVSKIAAERRVQIPRDESLSEESKARALHMIDQWEGSVLAPGDLAYKPEDLKRIACPALIVHGDRDVFFRVYLPVSMYESIPDSELCIMPNTGHAVPEPFTGHFLDILRDFLDRHPMAPGGDGDSAAG